MSIEGQGHFFTIYFPGFVYFVLYLDKISGESLQDHWSSGLVCSFVRFQLKLPEEMPFHFKKICNTQFMDLTISFVSLIEETGSDL